MPYMSADDFTVHADDCPDQQPDWMPLSDLPDEVESLDELHCECWDAYESLGDL